MDGKVYNKLVRDRIPAIIYAEGRTCTTEILSEYDYRSYLEQKLSEECAEYLESKDAEELADILEVVYAIGAAQGLSVAQLEQMRREKAIIRGGFKKRILLKKVESDTRCLYER